MLRNKRDTGIFHQKKYPHSSPSAYSNIRGSEKMSSNFENRSRILSLHQLPFDFKDSSFMTFRILDNQLSSLGIGEVSYVFTDRLPVSLKLKRFLALKVLNLPHSLKEL